LIFVVNFILKQCIRFKNNDANLGLLALGSMVIPHEEAKTHTNVALQVPSQHVMLFVRPSSLR
jgi:hypothetical protein